MFVEQIRTQNIDLVGVVISFHATYMNTTGLIVIGSYFVDGMLNSSNWDLNHYSNIDIL